jgi:hypothetical protein
MKKIVSFVVYVAVLFLFSCQIDEEENLVIADNKSDPKNKQQGFLSVPEAFPGEEGVVETGYLFGEPIEYVRINGQAVFQGDIILTDELLSATGNPKDNKKARTEGGGIKNQATRWPDNIVYYSISSDLPDKHRVTEAIAHWEANTNIRFIQREIIYRYPLKGFPTQEPNIRFVKGKGCSSSSIGMAPLYGQNITLGPGCNTSAAIHEIGHAVGLFHEHTRSDRQFYVNIDWNNIQKGKEHNFKQFGSKGFDHGTFDFASVMMYPSFAFTKDNTKPTITTKDGSLFNGGNVLSAGDIAIINEMYPNAIQSKWIDLKMSDGPLGKPTSGILPTSDGVGKYRNFQHGVIFWHPETAAHAVWGLIAVRWMQIGREAYGYPITDELPTPDGRGRFNHFRQIQFPEKPETSIYWTPQTGAHEIYGAIRSKWAEMGWETSYLGYPTSREIDFPGTNGRIQRFEGGFLYWTPENGVTDTNIPPPSEPLIF